MAILIFELLTSILIFVVSAVFLLYSWFQYRYTYWKNKGVKGPTPSFPFGNFGDVIKRKQHFFEPPVEAYWKYRNEPIIGLFFFQNPALCVNDPELAKIILMKDFDHFQAHGFGSGGDGNPMTDHIFNVHGAVWKNLRMKMSPTFSPRQLKAMYGLIENISSEVLTYVDSVSANNEAVNFSDLYSKYTMEIIGSVGFGVKCDGFKNPDSEFYRQGIEFLAPSQWHKSALRLIAIVVPNLISSIGLSAYNQKMVDFFCTLVGETVEYREKHSYVRNDFLQTLIEMKREANENKVKLEDGTDYKFSIEQIVANTVLYMVAGFDTSAAVGQFTALYMALYPEVQKRARQEVLDCIAKHNGEFTYEAQNEMIYINMVFDEMMRLYPPMRCIFRKCTKEYTMPDSGLVIEEGTRVFIPIHAIHKDPKIFPDPEKFDPERFSPENKAKLHPCHWMPFGEGPRKCLGLRQGYIQAKMALVKILQKYELVADGRTQVPLKINPSGLSLTVEDGIWIKLKQLSS